jgi:glycosyltransferase 2 family protein
VIRRTTSVIRILLGVSLLVFVLRRSGVDALVPVLSQPWILAALVGLTILGAWVEAERLRILFRAGGLNLTWQAAYRVVPVSNFFNYTIPGGTGGDVVKLYYLAKDNKRRGVEVATTVLVDRALALFAVLMFVTILMIVNRDLVMSQPVLRGLAVVVLGGVTALATVASLAWSTWLRSTKFYAWVMARMPLRRYVERVADALHSFGDRKRALAAAMLVSVCGHLAMAATFVAVASVVIPGAPKAQVALLSMTGMVANAIPLTPGGVGVGEAAFEQLFGLLGFHGGALLLVLWRVGMLPIATLGATLYITGQASRPQRLVSERAPEAS